MSLPVPDSKASSIDELIAQSVFRFEAKFASFGMLGLARVNGWIDDYRKELAGIAAAVRESLTK